jgi:hypothetical protein
MIENLEQQKTSLTALKRTIAALSPVPVSSTSEHLNLNSSHAKIPQAFNVIQPVFQKSENNLSADLGRKLTLIQPKGKTGLPKKPENSRNMGGDSFTCDASPHSPCIKFDDRKTGVGAGLLVHNAAHIAEINKNSSSIQIKFKNISFNCFEVVIGLFGLVIGSSFKKILIPANMQIAGDIRRDA